MTVTRDHQGPMLYWYSISVMQVVFIIHCNLHISPIAITQFQYNRVSAWLQPKQALSLNQITYKGLNNLSQPFTNWP